MKRKVSAVTIAAKPHPRAQGHRPRGVKAKFSVKQRAVIVVAVFAGLYLAGYLLHYHELTKGLDALLAVSTDRFLRDD